MQRSNSRRISTEALAQGTTLLEVLICLCIIVILARSGYAFVAVSDSITLKSAMELLVQSIETASAQSRSSGVARTIICDVHNHTYEANGTLFHLPKNVQFGIKSGVKGPPSRPSGEPVSSVTFPEAIITISDQGVVASGAVYLTDVHKKRQFCITCAVGQQRSIRCYEYKDSWQLLE